MVKGLTGIIVTLLSISLFVFAMVNFGVGVSQDNGGNQSIINHASISKFNKSVTENLENYEKDVNDSSTSFSLTKATTGSEGLQLLSVPDLWRKFITIPQVVYSLTLGLIFQTIFADEFSLVFILISSGLVVFGILYAWQWIRSGVPD